MKLTQTKGILYNYSTLRSAEQGDRHNLSLKNPYIVYDQRVTIGIPTHCPINICQYGLAYINI